LGGFWGKTCEKSPVYSQVSVKTTAPKKFFGQDAASPGFGPAAERVKGGK